jgi:hypothetical protein
MVRLGRPPGSAQRERGRTFGPGQVCQRIDPSWLIRVVSMRNFRAVERVEDGLLEYDKLIWPHRDGHTHLLLRGSR